MVSVPFVILHCRQFMNPRDERERLERLSLAGRVARRFNLSQKGP